MINNVTLDGNCFKINCLLVSVLEWFVNLLLS